MSALLIGLGVYRVWRLAAVDDITDPLRRVSIDKWRDVTGIRRFVADWFFCPWCSGFALTTGAVLLYQRFHSLPLPVLVAVAAMAIVGITDVVVSSLTD